MATPRKKTEIRRKVGRPCIYNLELADKICHLVATNPVGIDKICQANPELPDARTVNDWRFKFPEFSQKYREAKESQAELYANQTLEIADTDVTFTDKDGITRVDSGMVAWQKLKINARQWHASKMAPKIYGDKMALDNIPEHHKLKDEVVSLRKQLAEKSNKDY